MISLDKQIHSVQREIRMRKRVYPKWVKAGQLDQAKADYEIAAMEAVLVTLISLIPQTLELEEKIMKDEIPNNP